MYACDPLWRNRSITSPVLLYSPLNASQSTKTGSSIHSPVCWFLRRLLTAKPNFTTLPPLLKERDSGSRVSRPISITLFRLAMIGLLGCASPRWLTDRDAGQKRKWWLTTHNLGTGAV